MCELDKHVRISLRYTGSSKFEEAASERIKQPKVVYVLTQLWVFMSGTSDCLEETNSAQSTEKTVYFLSVGSGV